MVDCLLWALAGIGALVVLAVVLLFLAMLVDRLWELRKSKLHEEWTRGRDTARMRLHDDAWWFSEDEATMRAMMALAKGESVDEVRRKWREARKESAKQRYSMSPGMADQYRAEAKACRVALGFAEDDENVSPSDLVARIEGRTCRP